MKGVLSSAFLLAAVAFAGCTVHQTEAPPLSGPSGLALTIRVAALPDSISQDGGSQSSIQITAIGPDGRPKSGVALRVDMFVTDSSGALVGADYGTLSARTLMTNSNGLAAVVYTAPPSPVGGFFGSCKGLPGNCVVIVATPAGTDLLGANPESATIRLVPPGVILPPADRPTAQFTVAPSTPAANSPVAFDASASCPGGVGSTGGCLTSNNVLTDFAWSFGDGTTGNGKTVSHNYTLAGTYNVTLTVTNDRGLTASTTRQISVGGGAAPTAAFVFSPTPVIANVETFFDASASRAAAGHTIASYTWNWGDGDPTSTRSTPIESHDFPAAGTYTVVLTVTDESGQQGTATQSVTVGSGAPTASFTITKTGGNSVNADASASTATPGSTISTYTWLWGDGQTSSGTVASHTYGVAGTYTVTLRVTDNLGRTGTTTQSITVP